MAICYTIRHQEKFPELLDPLLQRGLHLPWLVAVSWFLQFRVTGSLQNCWQKSTWYRIRALGIKLIWSQFWQWGHSNSETEFFCFCLQHDLKKHLFSFSDTFFTLNYLCLIKQNSSNRLSAILIISVTHCPKTKFAPILVFFSFGIIWKNLEVIILGDTWPMGQVSSMFGSAILRTVRATTPGLELVGSHVVPGIKLEYTRHSL